MNKDLPFLDEQTLRCLLPYEKLIPALATAFREEYVVPQRHHHDYENPIADVVSTLLLMPAWQIGNYLGVKIVTVSPNNSQYKLPAVQGIYILFDAVKGVPIAYLEAKTLTTLRTAAASALASTFLSNEQSVTLLMIGTGAMAPELIKAHAAVRPIQNVYVWGRNFDRAVRVQEHLKKENFTIKAVQKIEAVVEKADIISCATLSEKPLILGKWLRAGQHIDLVGSFKPDMREADDEVLLRTKLYVDILEGATKESGDIVIPLSKRVITLKDIKGDLFDLCKSNVLGRIAVNDITCFKSVGYALEDLAAAKLAYEGSLEN